MPDLLQLSCRACNHATICGPAAMLDYLRQAKMVRRGSEPEPALIPELFRAASGKLICPQCGVQGLAVGPAPAENDEDWGMGRPCDECGKTIAQERIEVFPETRLCVHCQLRSDRGELSGPAEYCPRCGNVMSVRQSHAAGVTRYIVACPNCRK